MPRQQAPHQVEPLAHGQVVLNRFAPQIEIVAKAGHIQQLGGAQRQHFQQAAHCGGVAVHGQLERAKQFRHALDFVENRSPWQRGHEARRVGAREGEGGRVVEGNVAVARFESARQRGLAAASICLFRNRRTEVAPLF